MNHIADCLHFTLKDMMARFERIQTRLANEVPGATVQVPFHDSVEIDCREEDKERVLKILAEEGFR